MRETGASTKIALLSGWLKVLAEPNRLRIVALLMQGEQCNCEMGDRLDMAPNLISHHMTVLQKSGLVSARRDPDDARWIHYSIDTAALAELTTLFGSFFDTHRIEAVSRAAGPLNSFICLTDIQLGKVGDTHG